MNQKTRSLLIVGLSVLLFVGVTIVFIAKPFKNKLTSTKQSSTQEVDGTLPQLVCNYADDQAAYADAVNGQKVSQCECLTDVQLKDTCKDAVMNASFFAQALDQMDANLCTKISVVSQKDACTKVVESSVKQLQKEDPKYLAHIYTAAHSEQSVAALESLIASGIHDVGTYIALALAYAEKGLSEQEQGRDQAQYVTKALDAIKKAEAIDNGDAEVYRAKGYINEIKPDYDAAIAAYDKAIQINPDFILAYSGKGHVERMQGLLNNAVDDLNKAASLDTDRVVISIYANLCTLEFSRGYEADAIKNCKIVIGIKDADPVFQSEAYQMLSAIYVKNGDLTQAKSTLLTAKTLTPNDANLYVAFARVNMFEKAYEESESNARKAIELSSTKATAHLALAQALYMEGKYQEAITVAQKGVSLVANDVSLLLPSKPSIERDLDYMIAHCYRQMGNAAQQQIYEQKAQNAMGNNSSHQ